MKKILLLISCVLCLGIALGCSSGDSSASAEGAASSAKTEVVPLTIGTEANEGSIYYESIVFIKEAIEANTQGQVEVRLYPNSKLGDELSMMEQVRSGDLDMSIIGGANLASLVPELQILSVPYMFRDFDAFAKGMSSDSKLWKILVDTVASKNAGLHLAAATTIGSRWVVNRKGVISTPADMKKLGLKMRVQANPVESEVWSSFGSTPANMPMTDVFTAMQQGVVDAVENAPDLLYNYKIYEVAKYFSATDHNWYFAAVLGSDKIYTKVPASLHDAVRGAFPVAGKKILEITPQFQARAIDALRKTGADVNDKVDKQAFRGLILNLYEKVAKECGGEAILAAVNEL